MADTRKIVIEIVGGGGGSGDGTESSKKDDETDNGGKDAYKLFRSNVTKIMHPLDNAISDLPKDTLATAGIIGMAAKSAIGIASYVLVTDMNRFFTMKEDYIAQNAMGRLNETVGTVKGVLSSAVNGALQGASTGSLLGPSGAIIGAIAGATINSFSYVGTKRQEVLQREESYNMQLNATNMQTSYAESRASLVNGGRSTEN